MKNLPDDELFNALQNQLRNYSEQPDDEVWRKIAGALSPSREPAWIVWTNRMSTVFLLATALLLFVYDENSKIESLEKMQVAENGVTEPNRSISKTISTDNDESETKPTKENDLRETEEPHAFSPNEPSSMTQPALIENQSVINENPAALSVSPARVQEVLRNKSINDTKTDLFQAIKKIKEDSIRSIIQKERRKRSGLTVYTLVTPSLSFHRVSPISNDDVVIEKLNSPPVLSIDRLGISVEAGIQGKISARFQYIAGVSFYYQSQRMQYEQQSTDNVVVESEEEMSYTVEPGTLQNSFNYNMCNIGIQGGLLYTLKQHGLVHKAGIVLHYLKGLQRGENDVYNNAASTYLNYQLLYRVEYAFNPKMNLFIQPTYTHSVMANESLDAPFRLKQSRAGIGVGIVYSF